MSHELEGSVRRLERCNRMLVLALCAVVAAFWILGAAGGGKDATVRLERLELIDGEGNVRAVLGTDEDGSTGLFVHDTDGRPRVSLTHDADQTALFLRDAEGTIRVGVAQFAHGGGGVALHGAGSKGGAVLYLKDAGSLTFYDAEGHNTLRLPEE